jgi:hypothetical protein
MEETGITQQTIGLKSGFMCNRFFLSDSNIKLADRKYPLN